MLSNDAKQKPVADRSGYYKASFFFMASAIEALAFLIVKKFYDADEDGVYPSETTYTHLHTLPNRLFHDGIVGAVGVYEKSTQSFVWRDDMDFRTLNTIIRHNRLCDRSLCSDLEVVRKQRNRVHMQSLGQKDHQYTKKDVDGAQSVIASMLSLL